MEVKQVFAGKPYPSWIKKHKVFKEFKTINKIFPDIGLSNCEKEVAIDNSKEAHRSAKALMSTIRWNVKYRIDVMRGYYGKVENAKTKQRVNDILPILTSVWRALANKNADKVI